MDYFSMGYGFLNASDTFAAGLAIEVHSAARDAEEGFEQAKKRLEGTGFNLEDYIARPRPKKVRTNGGRSHEVFLEQHARAAQELEQVSAQAIRDANRHWSSGARYFAPVLYQVIDRSVEAFESDLQAITDVGWLLHSWHPIGPGPEPYRDQILLIQTLFSAPRPQDGSE